MHDPMPKLKRETLEDECTHILSEILNDQAPLYEEHYRPAARSMISVISAAECARIRRELLEDAVYWTNPVGDEWKSNEVDLRAALDRIAPAAPAPSQPRKGRKE